MIDCAYVHACGCKATTACTRRWDNVVGFSSLRPVSPNVGLGCQALLHLPLPIKPSHPRPLEWRPFLLKMVFSAPIILPSPKVKHSSSNVGKPIHKQMNKSKKLYISMLNDTLYTTRSLKSYLIKEEPRRAFRGLIWGVRLSFIVTLLSLRTLFLLHPGP